MVAVPTSPDLRLPLARALVCRLAELPVLPLTAVSVCTWLARLDGAIEAIDAGEHVVVLTAAGFLPNLYTPAGARSIAAQAPDVQFIAVDLRPALAAIRAAMAERN